MRLIDAEKLFDEVGRIKPKNKQHYKDIGTFMNMITNSSTIEPKSKQEPCEEEERMTNERAKDLLDNLVGMVEDNHDNDYDTALKMGIRAIGALEKIREEIEAVEPKSHVQYGMRWADTTLMIPFHKVMLILDKYAEQEPKTQMVDKSNFDVEQYKTDLQCAYDCGKASVKPCEDAISREDAIQNIYKWFDSSDIKSAVPHIEKCLNELPSVRPQEQKTGHCKDCKYFEYDKKFDAIPFILAHEICNKWGDGCKTSVDGYCYLFEPQERNDKE